MAKINLIAQVCMHNEVEKGNLDRCLDNLRRYCDRIVVYDDASIDDSVAVAEAHGCHVIRGQANNQCEELAHKQMLLEAALEMGATHLFWLDCDEVLDRPGTMGGLRELCRAWPDDLDAYSFPEINLWRSQTWQRTDSLFTTARFVRLWKVKPGLAFDVRWGVHKRLYPATIEAVKEAPYGVIHYGFWDYKKMLVKIGAHRLDTPGLQSCAEFGLKGQGSNWILDERVCSCRRVPDEMFPPGCLPPDIWEEPGPRRINELVAYTDLPDEPTWPLADCRAMSEWTRLHGRGYHGDYQVIKERNRQALEHPFNQFNRSSLFKFDPFDKVIIDLACGGGWFMLDCLRNGAHRVYGLEISDMLIDQAERSWRELGADTFDHKFLNTVGPIDIPRADVIYSVALFMHLPFWQSVRYFRWIYEMLKPGGEAHLQFYQEPGETQTMFWLGTVEGKDDSVSTVRLEHELARSGLVVAERYPAEGPGVLPVWQMYRCVRK